MINDDAYRIHKDNLLIVLCTVCTTPLGFTRELEKEILQSLSIVCPICKQRSYITKELKNYIVKS